MRKKGPCYLTLTGKRMEGYVGRKKYIFPFASNIPEHLQFIYKTHASNSACIKKITII